MHESLRLDEAVEFADNPEPRCPCILLLDTSGSMSGEPINALNEGIKIFRDELNRDSLAQKRIDVAIISFDNSVKVVQDFVTVDRFNPPTLTAQGLTSIGAAIQKALDMMTARKSQYRNNGVTYYRPWVFLITDGAPTDDADVVQQAAQRIKDEEARKGVAFFAVGVENADMMCLSNIAVRTPIKLKGLNFRELFLWLSASMGWGEV
jgi:uncharacterized protein YegL